MFIYVSISKGEQAGQSKFTHGYTEFASQNSIVLRSFQGIFYQKSRTSIVETVLL